VKQHGGKEAGFYNRSLERALQILNVFDKQEQTDSNQSLSLAQLSEILNLPRATVLRLCATLTDYDFLRQNPDTKRYSLGFRLFELGSIVFYSFSLRKTAAPFLDQLQTKLGKTVFLGILEKDELLYIDKREDQKNPISFTSKIGTRRPPYWGLLGPVLMAYLPEEEAAQLLQKTPLTATTKRSYTKKEDFLDWLRQIRDTGHAIDIETAMDGISGIGAPIYDFTGRVVAAIGIGFISSSLDPQDFDKAVKEVVDTAVGVSRELGYVEKKGQ
jgi:IclR family transcriptional regulator, KDG regulon repressor